MVTRKVDLKGFECPEPAIMMYREFGRLDPGDWLEAEMDEEACALTAAEMINRSGFGVAVVEDKEKEVFVIRALRVR